MEQLQASYEAAQATAKAALADRDRAKQSHNCYAEGPKKTPEAFSKIGVVNRRQMSPAAEGQLQAARA